MVRKAATVLLIAWAAALSGTALAESIAMPVDISAGPLPQSLQTLQRQTGIELLFDQSAVRELQSPAVLGTLTPEAALRQLLGETSLSARRAESGAWIVERPAAPPLAQQDAAVPEILVVGRRTQNADIRRFENDVQPYTVATQTEILASHRDNLDQYIASRVTSSTTAIPPALQQTGSTLSSIDLRGLGSEQTLVLIDGRRMPSVSNSYIGFLQSDLGAIPLHAVERVEILTGTAGGIHGFGALGGVVNVVLDRDTSGLDLHYSDGISSRGDARRQTVEAKYGRSFNDGATDLVLFAGHSESDTVLAGERAFANRDRRRTYDLLPDRYTSNFVNGNSVRVDNIPDTGLEFKPEFGGTTLASSYTYLPVGFSGDAPALATALTQHAGQVDFSLTDIETHTDLGSNPTSDAWFANIHHRFNERWEGFVDAVVLRSRGESRGDNNAVSANVSTQLPADSPFNPFTTTITVSFPVEGLTLDDRTKAESMRYTAGLLAELPADWRGTAEMSWGSFSNEGFRTIQIPGDLALHGIGDPSRPDLNPFGDWDTFQRAISPNPGTITNRFRTRTSFDDFSVRVGGPAFSTAAGPATLSLLAERRHEDLPAYEEDSFQEFDGEASNFEFSVPSRSVVTTSLYAELRAKFFDLDAPAALLRGLELQLAVRRDDEEDDFLGNPMSDEDSYRIHSKFTGTTYTAGAKLTPTPWLMLRGSYATGEQPPDLNFLAEVPALLTDLPFATDPQRGDTYIGADEPYLLRLSGNPDLKPVRASTTSLGVVLTPTGADGARLAVDYSLIRRSRDLFVPDFTTVLEHEDFWPQRVERAPLTDDDRANGYTAGRVTMFDIGWDNGATLEIEALDLHADWPLAMFGGRLQLYADATRFLHNVKSAPFQPDLERIGYREAPLKWRANGGFDWSRESLTIGANAQFFEGSLINKAEGDSFPPEYLAEYQGSKRIASQWYLDLYGNWRVPVRDVGPLTELNLNLGIINVFDTAPPRTSYVIDQGPGYSRYGDPRQRRFELVLSTRF